MPSPNKGEQKKDFIDRCMGDGEANNSFPDASQRAAFCYSQWDRHQKQEQHQMSDSVHLNGAGRAHLNSLVDAGKVDKASAWDLTTEERDALETNMFLGADNSLKPEDKGHWKYPFGKNGKVYASALRAIDSRAGAQGETEIQNAAKAALDKINAKKEAAAGDPPPTGTIADREIFKMGTWRASTGKVEATSSMLNDMVNSYEQLNSKVPGYAIPIKLGHTNVKGAPAMGYATNVRRVGDTLLADFTDMPPEIVDAVKAKRYNSVSVEVWPTLEHGDTTFDNVLSGVALLGAEWPAVKGLKPIYASEFANDGGTLLSQEEDKTMHFTQEQHDALVAAAVEKAKADAKTEFSAQIETLTQERDVAKAALAAFADEAEKKDIAAIIEAAEKDGKIVPANKDKIMAFAESIRSKLSGADRTGTLAMFKDFVESLPKKVDFSEKGGSKNEKPGDGENVSAEVDTKVKAAQKAAGGASKLSYADALKQVFEEDPDLKTRYAEETR